MTALHKNRVQMTSATTGTGTLTLGSASSGYQTFAAAYGADATVDVLITEGTTWEVARNCAYTNSGTTLGRGTLEASSSGSAISFLGGQVVSEVMTAARGNSLEAALEAVTPGGRLTLESGVPVSTTDQTAKTSVYYTPYVHNIVNLWNGSNWVPTTFTEKTLALGTITNGLPYDVFGYLTAGALTLELLAWTSGTARATAVTLQDGRYAKNGDKTRLLLGTFYTTATTTTEDSVAKRFVDNLYNAKGRKMYKAPAGTQNTTSEGMAEYSNGGALAKLERVVCDPAGKQAVLSETISAYSTVALDVLRVFLCLNGTVEASENGPGADVVCQLSTASARFTAGGSYRLAPGYSYHTVAIARQGGTGTLTASAPAALGEHPC